MSRDRSAYHDHSLIRDSIDLLAAGAAWKSGVFRSRSTDLPPSISDSVSSEGLVSIARDMLLDGRGYGEANLSPTDVSFAYLPDASKLSASSTLVEFVREQSSFDPPGTPILSNVYPSLDIYERALGQLSQNPAAAEVVAYAMAPLVSALGVQPVLLDQRQVAANHPLAVITAAFAFQFEVQLLRHNIAFALGQLAGDIAAAANIPDIYWSWEGEWNPQGMCRYGPVYQVFLSKGIDLYPVKQSELGGLAQLRDAGLISTTAYQECAASYT